ncbi:unnamed protein product [Peniophora sp. CBMAI 1063]|nr:unnamed protein product [Peniophora sp. CBMAI 1063]
MSDYDAESDDSLDSNARFDAQRPGRLRRAERFLERRVHEHGVQVAVQRKAREALRQARTLEQNLSRYKAPFYKIFQLERRGLDSSVMRHRAAYAAGIKAKEAKGVWRDEHTKAKATLTLCKQANAYVNCLEQESDVYCPAGTYCCSDWSTDSSGETDLDDIQHPEPGLTRKQTLWRHREIHRAHRAREQMLEEALTDEYHEDSEEGSVDREDSGVQA